MVIWDLDQTILTGILEEGDEEKNPIAGRVIQQLDERGILQAMATQNSPDIVPPALEKLGWRNLFIRVEGDQGPKVKKLRRILDALEVNILDTAFVDEDPFERDFIAAQMADITWSIADLVDYLDGVPTVVTEEARRQPSARTLSVLPSWSMMEITRTWCRCLLRTGSSQWLIMSLPNPTSSFSPPLIPPCASSHS